MKTNHLTRALVALTYLLLTACDQNASTENDALITTTKQITSKENNKPTDIGHLTTEAANQIMRAASPEILAYQATLAEVLKRPLPIFTLADQSSGTPPSAQSIEAETLVIKHRGFQKYLHHLQNQQALRNEIMVSRPALPGDYKHNETAACTQEKAVCYRVDMYNYFYNITSTALVDLTAKRILSIDHLPNTQPDLNPQLKVLANAIANNSPDVKQRLGEAHGTLKPTMAEIKTALKDSRCERSKHLCVAPTYVVGDRALWAIVDLTDLELVGLRWSELGTAGPPILITERSLENRYVFNEFCEKVNQFEMGDWAFDYNITSSDGMNLTAVKYKQQAVMNSVKLVDWHVSYSKQDNFGYSDAIGCPLFSSAVVVAYSGPSHEAIMQDGEEIGFAFIQDFRQQPWPTPCNYRYEQRFEFYHDGRFRIAFADYGRGCGTDGTYRPVSRIDLAQPEGKPFDIAHYADNEWQNWDKEKWTQQDDMDYFDTQYTHKISNASGEGYYLAPGNGQYEDGGRGDHAYVYATVKHTEKDEGERDLSTLGSCCNTDFQQGPELFMSPAESLVNQDWVLWYVAQIKNDGGGVDGLGSKYCWADTEVVNGTPEIKVWPCFAGPMFVPIQ
ncbi:MAG: hypothetical protein V3V09_03085 [Arenicellales bacterium]